MSWFVALLILLVIAPFVVESQRRRMGGTARKAAPGDIATLTQGKTHYRWYGPEGGPVVLCIHGLTTPSFVWHSIATELAQDGYRVLTYDLYGRGFSDRPKGPQDSAFFLRQITDLLNDQSVDGTITIVGYSMGGAVATALAAERPHRVERVVLVAPAGIRMAGQTLLRFVVPIPFAGMWAVLGLYPFILARGIRGEANDRSSVPHIETLQLAELRWQGFLPAVRASMRDMLAEDQETAHRMVHQHGLAVQAIWGEMDSLIPLEARDILGDWNPNAVHHTVTGAGHGLTYTDTDAVLAVLKPGLPNV